MDSMRLELFKNKDERAQSAIASQEVRKHLAGFIRSKRLGSSSHIDGGGQQQQQQQQALSPTPGSSAGSKSGATADPQANQAAGCPASLGPVPSESDDHPLRKTASMPTMHIPYKAQSLSRRRQMERRTTMSPLMRRNPSRARRLPAHPLDPKAQEYSSNPCIMMAHSASSHRNHRNSNQLPASLSQSSSPPAGPSARASACVGPATNPAALNRYAAPSGRHHCDQQATISMAEHMMRASSHSNLDKSSSSSSSSNQQQQQLNSRHAFPSNAGEHQEELLQKQLQHSRVQEAIRKTVIGRASSRSRMAAAGGSLDSEMCAAFKCAPDCLRPHAQPACEGAATSVAPADQQQQQQQQLQANPLAGNSGFMLGARNREELRQWSLDGADTRVNSAQARLAAANRTLAWGLFHRLRLATTTDAASLRQSQAPSSSISMGVTSGANLQQAAVAPIGQQQQLLLRAGRLYSSSSSSTSSLLSAQDSLDDSSSQAIDLSSSSEAGRQRQQLLAGPNNQGAFSRSMMAPPPPLLPSDQQQQQQQQQQQAASRLNYQKVLQDSFNQLQLCQSQQAGMKRMLLPAHSIEIGQLGQQQQHAYQQHQHQHQHQQHPLLGQTNSGGKTALSLDVPGNQAARTAGDICAPNNQFLASLADQFDLSDSAQNLISMQQQQQQQQQQQFQLNNLIAQQQQQQQDLNDWLTAYNNLVQSSDFQRPSQTINSSLLAKMAVLPEPYQSALVAQLIQQQQQQHQVQLLACPQTAPNQQAGALLVAAGEQQQQQQQQQQRANSIGRALSSPILIGADNNHTNNNSSATHKTMEVEMQTDEPRQTGAESDRVDEEIGMFALSLQRQLDAPPAHQLSLDLSQPRREGAGEDCGAPAAKLEGAVGSLQANFASMSCSASSFSSNSQQQQQQLEFNQQLSNCTNLLYNPVFRPTSSTGLVYELELCNHKCICNEENNHPENSYRVLAIWRRLYDSGLMSKCARISGRKASLSELQLCHSETYANYFGRNPYERVKLRQLDLSKLPIKGLTQLECGGQGADIDTAWNEEKTPAVARLAAGCVIEAALQVAQGKLLNAFAIVRPPGHHAEFQQAMGFCFFNSLAIAARVLLERHQLDKLLIVDWDVHHGNGIQKSFYEDPRVMYISLHRHDQGHFFPGTGNPLELGAGPGAGFNWNVAWSGESMGDAEYLAAFRALVMPIGRDFNPSMVLVACGFDGARGHPFNFGGYQLSPACFAHMTRQLMGLANGRLLLSLEGGYQLGAICDCAEACVRALLKEGGQKEGAPTPAPLDHVLECELKRRPNQSARELLHQLSGLAAKYWPSVQMWRHTIEMSAFDAANKLL